MAVVVAVGVGIVVVVVDVVVVVRWCWNCQVGASLHAVEGLGSSLEGCDNKRPDLEPSCFFLGNMYIPEQHVRRTQARSTGQGPRGSAIVMQ